MVVNYSNFSVFTTAVNSAFFIIAPKHFSSIRFHGARSYLLGRNRHTFCIFYYRIHRRVGVNPCTFKGKTNCNVSTLSLGGILE